jgi:hypothetical protein
MDLSLTIDVISNPDPNFFYSNYIKKNKPALIKGLTVNAPAMTKWNFGYFQETMGHFRVPVFDTRKTTSISAYTKPDLYMRFGDFLDCLQNQESCPYRIFLFDVFRANPELRKDFPCPELAKGILGKLGFIFFASKNTSVRMHYDIDMSHVFHTQFSGKKRAILFAPEFSSLLYRLPLNTFSLVDLFRNNRTIYPGLQYVKGYDVVLEHGDTLFIPSGYWHEMNYLENGFSVSYRKLSSRISQPINGFLNLSIFMWMDKAGNFISKEKWLKAKQNIAERRANSAIKKLSSLK